MCRTLHLCCWQSNLRRRLIICKAFLQVYGPTSPCCIARTIPLTHISYIYMYMYMDICSDTNKWIHNYIYMQTNNLYNIYIYTYICASVSLHMYIRLTIVRTLCHLPGMSNTSFGIYIYAYTCSKYKKIYTQKRFTYLYIHIHLCVYMHTCKFVHMYIYMYMFMCSYVCTYVTRGFGLVACGTKAFLSIRYSKTLLSLLIHTVDS